jgi:hypothetical protein
MPVYGYYVFPKPSVDGCPTAATNPADRRCRYLVHPPTVPSLARLRGYRLGVEVGANGHAGAPPSGAAAAAPPASAHLKKRDNNVTKTA